MYHNIGLLSISLHFLFSSVNSDSFLTRCIHLLAELSQQKSMADKVSSLLPAVAEPVRHRHYDRQHLSLLETLLCRIPHIARGLGKRLFKRHLELFLDHMFYGTVRSTSLCTVYMSSTHESQLGQVDIDFSVSIL